MMEELTIPCEGSGCFPTHIAFIGGDGLCPMCGGEWSLDENDRVVAHDRVDILTMIRRGDFG